jgi:hypothetical protein
MVINSFQAFIWHPKMSRPFVGNKPLNKPPTYSGLLGAWSCQARHRNQNQLARV